MAGPCSAYEGDEDRSPEHSAAAVRTSDAGLRLTACYASIYVRLAAAWQELPWPRLGVYFVTVVTSDHSQPWWPHFLLSGLARRQHRAPVTVRDTPKTGRKPRIAEYARIATRRMDRISRTDVPVMIARDGPLGAHMPGRAGTVTGGAMSS